MKEVYQSMHRRTMIVMTVVSFLATLLTGCANPYLSDTSSQNQTFLTDDNMGGIPAESRELHEESGEPGIESEEEVDAEDAESKSKETDASTATDIKDITWEQVDDNVVDLHFVFEDTVVDKEIIAYSVRDIAHKDITGDGVEEVLIYCDFANNICDWQLVYFYQIEQGNVMDISPTKEDIPELENVEWGLWDMWIAAETMEGYSSPIYKLESYFKEQGEVYVEETLYIGYRAGKWELVQESAFR